MYMGIESDGRQGGRADRQTVVKLHRKTSTPARGAGAAPAAASGGSKNPMCACLEF